MTTRTDLAIALLEARKRHGLNQRDAAARFDVTNAAYNRWEQSLSRPGLTAALLASLEDFLEVDAAEVEHLVVISEVQMNARRDDT